jgi:hypothetical protein
VTRLLLFALLMSFEAAASASNDDLKQELQRKQAQLADLSHQVDETIGPEFRVDHDIQLRLATKVIQAWADKISLPTFSHPDVYAIGAVATRVDGDLVDGNGYRVYIWDASNTGAVVLLSGFYLQFSSQHIHLSLALDANAHTRIWVDSGPIRPNFYCESNPDVTAQVEADFQITSQNMGGIQYVINLTRPNALSVRVVCHLGDFGDLALEFPVDQLAKQIGQGDLNLGFQNKIVLTTPTIPPKSITLNVQTRDFELTIDTNDIQAQANIDVGSAVGPQ